MPDYSISNAGLSVDDRRTVGCIRTEICGICCLIVLISAHFQSLGALSGVLIFLNSSDVSRIFFCFIVVLLSQFIIRCNDKTTVSARMSLQ